LTEGLCATFGLSMPMLHVIEDDVPNACALGRDARRSDLVVTTGLLRRVDPIELEGVIAHELAHVKRGDNGVSCIGITLGTLYQKRYCGRIDWRAGNSVQYAGALLLFGLAAFAFETRTIHWSGELVFAMVWLVLVLSIAAVGLMYWLIRRSAATGFASLFYLVPVVTALFAFMLFGEKLDAVSIAGMVVCAVGVVLANRGARMRPTAANAAASVAAEG